MRITFEVVFVNIHSYIHKKTRMYEQITEKEWLRPTHFSRQEFDKWNYECKYTSLCGFMDEMENYMRKIYFSSQFEKLYTCVDQSQEFITKLESVRRKKKHKMWPKHGLMYLFSVWFMLTTQHWRWFIKLWLIAHILLDASLFFFNIFKFKLVKVCAFFSHF